MSNFDLEQTQVWKSVGIRFELFCLHVACYRKVLWLNTQSGKSQPEVALSPVTYKCPKSRGWICSCRNQTVRACLGLLSNWILKSSWLLLLLICCSENVDLLQIICAIRLPVRIYKLCRDQEQLLLCVGFGFALQKRGWLCHWQNEFMLLLKYEALTWYFLLKSAKMIFLHYFNGITAFVVHISVPVEEGLVFFTQFAWDVEFKTD